MAQTGLPSTAKARVFQGWIVVAAAFSVLFLAYGVQFSYGVFVTPMAAELGWSRADTSLPYSLYVFGYSALSAVTGRATDRFGPRVVIAWGALLLGCGWGASALVSTRWQLWLTLGVVASIGMSVAWVPCNATVARWFTRRRGFAVAIASSGASFGNFLVPPLVAPLVDHYGWRPTLGGLALASACLIFVASRHMSRDPEAHGLWPDGDAAPPANGAHLHGLRASEAVWTLPFILLCAIYLLNWLAVFVPLVHGVAYAEDLGLGKVAGASVLSAIGIGGIVGRLSSGALSDRLGQFVVLIGIFALQVLSFLLFANATSLGPLWVAAALFGLSYGGGVTVVAPLCSVLFGRAHVASVVGALFSIAAAPAAIGPWLAGWLHDSSGDYFVAFMLCAGVNALALGLSLVLAWQQARQQASGTTELDSRATR